MNITIETPLDLSEQLLLMSMKPGERIQALCLALIEHGQSVGEKTVVVRIAPQFVASSYTANPAMFVATLVPRCAYPHLQSFLKDGFMIVRAGVKRKPLTFRGIVREALEEKGTYTTRRTLVPKSYRRRPSILSTTLTEELTQEVCNECKGEEKEFMRWYFKD